MPQLVETIRIHQGQAQNIAYHNHRLNESNKYLNGYLKNIDIDDHILIPDNYSDGLYKCRVIYNGDIERVEFSAYNVPEIHSLALIQDDTIDYEYKWTDRSLLSGLYQQKKKHDDILIVKNGLITDSYYCNVALSKNGIWYTPKSPLLNGTRRAQLLCDGIITEKNIQATDILEFEEIRMFNAMIEFGDITISTSCIYKI